MKKLLSLLCPVAGLLALSGSAGARATETAFPPTVTPTDWVLQSNANWTTDGGPATVISAPNAGDPLGDEAQGGIWSTICLQGQQGALFTRTVDLPGPPRELDVTLDRDETAPFTGTGVFPFPAVELVVNHKTVLEIDRSTVDSAGKTWGGGGPGHDGFFSIKDPAKLAAFTFGQNTIKLLVTRAPLPASPPQLAPEKCNTGAGTAVSIRFSLRASSAADLDMPPGKANTRYVLISRSTRIVRMHKTFLIHNYGPSAALDGEFHLEAVASIRNGLEVDPQVLGKGPFRTCAAKVDAAGQGLARCHFDAFPPGTSAQISWEVDVCVQQQNCASSGAGVTWGVRSKTPGVEGSGHRISFTERFRWCTSREQPNCQNAEPPG